MKTYYYYEGQWYNYSQIKELEKKEGWKISALYPNFEAMQKVTIASSSEEFARYYNVQDYHLEFFPTNKKEYSWVSDDPRNPGALHLSFPERRVYR